MSKTSPAFPALEAKARGCHDRVVVRTDVAGAAASLGSETPVRGPKTPRDTSQVTARASCTRTSERDSTCQFINSRCCTESPIANGLSVLPRRRICSTRSPKVGRPPAPAPTGRPIYNMNCVQCAPEVLVTLTDGGPATAAAAAAAHNNPLVSRYAARCHTEVTVLPGRKLGGTVHGDEYRPSCYCAVSARGGSFCRSTGPLRPAQWLP